MKKAFLLIGLIAVLGACTTSTNQSNSTEDTTTVAEEPVADMSGDEMDSIEMEVDSLAETEADSAM